MSIFDAIKNIAGNMTATAAKGPRDDGNAPGLMGRLGHSDHHINPLLVGNIIGNQSLMSKFADGFLPHGSDVGPISNQQGASISDLVAQGRMGPPKIPGQGGVPSR